MAFPESNRLDYGMAQGSGTATRTGTTVDTKRFSGTTFLLVLGAIASGFVGLFKVQGSHDDSAWADLENTGQAIADDDDNGIKAICIQHSRHRYLRAVVVKDATNSCEEAILAVQSGANSQPVTHGTDITAELHHAPAEGTA